MRKQLFLISLAIVVADQITKWLIISNIALGELVPVFFWFDLTNIGNRGVAFSMFANLGSANIIFMVVALVAVVAIFFWLWRYGHKENVITRYAMLLIMGGACGNLIDRVRFGYVIDFIAVHYKNWYYPSFNIADAAITIGALMLVTDILLRAKKKELS